MTDQTKNKIKYWLIGLFTGASVSAPITAFFVKKVCDKKSSDVQQVTPTEPVTQEPKSDEQYAEKEPEPNIPEVEEINNWDLNIDDKEATEEARERSEEHERYLDMIDKYKGDDVMTPRIISEDQFIEEQYMQKSYVNWYEYDNVFEENLEPIIDPYASFGVANGSELFRNSDERSDPNIVYVRNEKFTTDYEITRIHGSYAMMVGGESSLGETDT